MRKQQQKTINQTFEEKLQAKKEELRQAYLMANEDPGQLEAAQDWEVTL